ncbi:unnamed protein product [Musa textilis]
MDKFRDSANRRFLEELGVGDGLGKLMNSLTTTRHIIGEVKIMLVKDEDMKKWLMEIKDTAYDAEDLLDEIQFRVLKQQIEKQGVQGDEESNQSSSSSNLPPRKKRKFPVPERASRFLGRGYDDDDEMTVRKIQAMLDKITADIGDLISTFDADEKHMIEIPVFGREEQLNHLLEQLVQSADGSGSSDSSISTLTIVGIGGVGKTTLAQQAYNHERVQDYFQLKCDLNNSDTLQVVVKEKLTSKRFLLVLDDVWNEDSLKWERFCAPLRSAVPGSKILVTTRSEKIADMVGNPFPLDVLDDASYWEFFKQCAFGSEDAGEYPQLEAIAKKIAYRLDGLPLAARTVGRLLNGQIDEEHWRIIAGSEIWQLSQDEKDVLRVLQLSYQLLPPHLERCFLFCSLFPKDHRFDGEDLVRLWMAEGCIAQDNMNDNMRLEAVGNGYFRDLVNMSFFQEASQRSAYVMHDLIHKFAQLISEGEFCRIDDDKSKEIPNITRHLSAILTDGTKLMEFSCYEKLRTLMINYEIHWYGSSFPSVLFERLKNIRVLILRYCGLRELPETIGDLIHLRYLDISYNRRIWRLPESLCGLYNLQVLDLFQCPLQSFPDGMSKLINLMHLNAADEIISKINNVGKLTSLQGLSSFKVLEDQGHEVAQLGGLKQLHGQLRITNLENVENKQEASKANNLNNKQYLDALALEWTSDDGSSLDGNELVVSEEVLEGLQPHQALKRLTIRGYNGVRSPSWLQAQLLLNLITLELENCTAWEDLSCIGQLPNLKNLYVKGMPAVKQVSHGLNQGKCFPSLEELTFGDMPEWEEWSWADGGELFPCLRKLEIVRCPKLQRLPPLPPLKTLRLDEKLSIRSCPKLLSMTRDGDIDIPLPPSIEELLLSDCGNVEKLLPGCLHNSTSLTRLEIGDCRYIESLPATSLLHLKRLESLSIWKCGELRSIDGLRVLKSFRELTIKPCPKLLLKEGNKQVEGLSVSKLCIDDTALFKLSLLGRKLPSVRALTTLNFPRATMSDEEEQLFRSLTARRSLEFENCKNLQSLPRELNALSSLRLLRIIGCQEIQSLPEKGLPTSLRNLHFQGCHAMLTEQLEKHLAEMKSSDRFFSLLQLAMHEGTSHPTIASPHRYHWFYVDQPCTAMSSWILAGLGSLGQAVIGSLMDKITDYVIGRFSEDPGVSDLHDLRNTLSETEHIIGRVDNMWIEDGNKKKLLKELLMKLKDTVYDADDFLDEIQFQTMKQQIEQQGAQGYEANNQSSSSSGLPPSKRRKFSERVSCFFGRGDDVIRVREIQMKFHKYTTDIEHFIATLDANEKQMITSVVPRTTTSFPIETQVFGRKEQLNQLLGRLVQSGDESGSSDSSISTLTIVGIGGVGKTTLAQQAYNHERVKDYFQQKVWVCVSDTSTWRGLPKRS